MRRAGSIPAARTRVAMKRGTARDRRDSGCGLRTQNCEAGWDGKEGVRNASSERRGLRTKQVSEGLISLSMCKSLYPCSADITREV